MTAWAKLRVSVTLVGFIALAGASLGSCMTAAWTPGQRLFRSKCGACHPRPDRGTRSRAQWQKVLEGHGRHFTLTAKDRSQLLDWVSPRKHPPTQAP